VLRHAVEAVRTSLGARKSHIRNRTRNAAATVIERMERNKPEMRETSLQDIIDLNPKENRKNRNRIVHPQCNKIGVGNSSEVYL
jgi:hypothetical protein